MIALHHIITVLGREEEDKKAWDVSSAFLSLPHFVDITPVRSSFVASGLLDARYNVPTLLRAVQATRVFSCACLISDVQVFANIEGRGEALQMEDEACQGTIREQWAPFGFCKGMTWDLEWFGLAFIVCERSVTKVNALVYVIGAGVFHS